MALPTGVTTCVVSAGSALDFTGEDGTITLTVEPVLGGNAKAIVWAATGQALVGLAATASGDTGMQASVVMPHVDQPGFIDGSGNEVKFWSYRATRFVKIGSVKVPLATKVFQIVQGQTAVDLDMIPDGQITSQTSAPIPAVTSVNGQTGAVTVESGGVDDATLAGMVTDTGTATGAALAGEFVAQSQLGTDIPTLDPDTGNVLDADGQPVVGATDASVAAAVAKPLTSAALDARATSAGRGLSRVLTKLQTGKAVAITYIGDSGLEGQTVTTPGVDDCASMVESTLNTRFAVTTIKNNRAKSGYVAYFTMNPALDDPTRFSLALADEADLYVIAFGHNDLRSDTDVAAAQPSNGYPRDASIAAVEHMIRRIRIDVPGADIAISNEWQYTGSSVGSNLRLIPYNNAVRQLAATYGCAFIDFYGALADLGVTGSTPETDDLYIGSVTAQHPNSAGHAVWAKALTDQLGVAAAPVVEAPTLPAPTRGGERYTGAGWVSLPLGAGGSRVPGFDGIRVMGTWSGDAASGTLPKVTTTAGDKLEFEFTGSELALQLDTGAGQGIVKIETNAQVLNSGLDLSTLSGTRSFIPIVGLGQGIHRVVVTVVSGSVTFRGAQFLPTIALMVPYTSGLVTYTGTWAETATYPDAYMQAIKSSNTLNDTVTVEWVGTALWLNGYRYGSTTWRVGVTTDGGGKVITDMAIAGGASQSAGWLVTSGLPYGQHTTTISIEQASRQLIVSSFLAVDEYRTERPNRLVGAIVAGNSFNSPTPLPAVPAVRLAPGDATSAIPPYPSNVSTGGFTANGSAGARLVWDLDTGRMAY